MAKKSQPKTKLRLDKMLGNMGVGTRKEVKLLVRWGRVTVNGQRAWTGADYIDTEKDQVVVDGVPVSYQPLVYLMLNKPAGYVSATEDSREATVLELVPEAYRHYPLFPMGRLDKDTEGLLILTNDGQLAHSVLTPKNHVPKTYEATVAGMVTEATVAAFQAGILLDDGYTTMPAQLVCLEQEAGESKIRLTIYEGKFHQVKRMFESVGMQVTYLKRISMGQLILDPTLESGEVRELEDEEIESLGTID